ncbi:SprT-like domain-containing protein [Motilibacter aurantiacus]|uniref:SprT-like domain-containing protein n=1 Tax=Motilibacter aurantiacus TaxID=2714955 RepID=UPI0014081089|nr:SprT-like domain-containing protein [Motilibacter aurantiacus]NHC44479.1 SprT family zinc-dependent metalloprotease [Motilibacter aurantiacus]
MELAEARAHGEELLHRHGLAGWRLVFDNAKTRAGVCRFERKEIGLSRVLTQLHTAAEVRDTLLHEIAHALVGPRHGHDRVWRARALAIGCSGERCVPATAERAPGPWLGVCPQGHETTRHRRPEKVQSCAKCSRRFDLSAVFRWTYRGQEVPMHPAYEAQLAFYRSRAARAARTAQAAQAGAASAGGQTAAASVTATPRPTAPGPAALPVGAAVRLGGRGKYAGLRGTIEKRGRTRYHVRTRLGLVAAPFELVERQ